MFTGIIEATATLEEIREEGSSKHFALRSSLAPELHIDQSLSHDGVCLTVTEVETERYWTTAVAETLGKSTLGKAQPGRFFNLERSMQAGARFDGHIVQGHVDQVGTCTGIEEVGGSWLMDFAFAPTAGHPIVEKGSMCINGTSLTIFNTRPGAFRVTIIPYTFYHTNFQYLKPGDPVNLEFDILGKYVEAILAQRSG